MIKCDEINAEAERDSSVGGIVLAREGLNANVRLLSEVDNFRFLRDLLTQWGIIGLAIGIAIWSSHWLFYVAAFIIISSRQHALGILMHDATHFRCLSNKTANNFFSDVFCAFPLGMSTSRYRYEHILHHRYLNTENDPYWREYQQDIDWHWPKTKKQAIGVLLRDLFGLNTDQMMPVIFRWSPWINHFSKNDTPPPLSLSERLTFYLFLVSIGTLLFILDAWVYFLFLWILPLLTLTTVFVRFRTIGEHLAIPNKSELDASRHTDGAWLEHIFISPFNINYHIDHHLFASVPYYNLPKLHKVLLENPHYRRHARINKTYLGTKPGGLLNEILV